MDWMACTCAYVLGSECTLISVLVYRTATQGRMVNASTHQETREAHSSDDRPIVFGIRRLWLSDQTYASTILKLHKSAEFDRKSETTTVRPLLGSICSSYLACSWLASTAVFDCGQSCLADLVAKKIHVALGEIEVPYKTPPIEH